jgi:hypothetical protein
MATVTVALDQNFISYPSWELVKKDRARHRKELYKIKRRMSAGLNPTTHPAEVVGEKL